MNSVHPCVKKKKKNSISRRDGTSQSQASTARQTDGDKAFKRGLARKRVALNASTLNTQL